MEHVMSNKTDKEIIEANGWANCRICFDAFRRKRETLRYCAKCHNGFCEGEHGNFAFGHGTCVICGARKDYTAPRVPYAVQGVSVS
jgi:hypothetical protein